MTTEEFFKIANEKLSKEYPEPEHYFNWMETDDSWFLDADGYDAGIDVMKKTGEVVFDRCMGSEKKISLSSSDEVITKALNDWLCG